MAVQYTCCGFFCSLHSGNIWNSWLLHHELSHYRKAKQSAILCKTSFLLYLLKWPTLGKIIVQHMNCNDSHDILTWSKYKSILYTVLHKSVSSACIKMLSTSFYEFQSIIICDTHKIPLTSLLTFWCVMSWLCTKRNFA